MSKAKFAAAKELIEEGSYDEARAILRKIDHPTASKWLKQIDQIDPPFPEHAPQPAMSETEKYYKRKNRSKRKSNFIYGLSLIGGDIVLLLLAAYIYHQFSQLQTGILRLDVVWGFLFPIVLGVLTILAGVWWSITCKKMMR